ncbi:MAG: PAS domain-containing protein [Flavobacteriaceae bacterium]
MKTLEINHNVKNSPACMAVLDRDMRIIECSRTFLKESLHQDADIVGKLFYEVFTEFPDELRYNGSDHFVDQQLHIKIERISSPQKGVKWYKWKVYSLTDNSGEHLGFTLVREDISALKRNEELLEKSMNVARVGGWEVDLINNNVFWTDVTREIHEVEPDYVPCLEEGINFYKAGEDRDKITALVSEAISEGKPWDTELRIITAKGREVWIRAKGEAEIVDGECIRLLGIFQDIDEKKKAELDIRGISERFALATNAANVGVWDYNVVDNTLVWDENMYRLYGVRKEDFSGVYDAWESAVHPDDQEAGKNRIQMAISGEEEFDTEFRVVWPNNEIRYIRAFAITQQSESGEALRMIGTNWDITEIRQAEDKLKNLLDITSEQNKSLMNFAHIVSHNLRSHASNLSMLTGFLCKETKEEEKVKLVEMLDEASESLNETVQHLNDVVRVKTGASEKIKPVNLLNALKTVQKNLRLLLKEKSTHCSIDISAELFVHAIPAYLDSILLNLFTNSLKYSHEERDLEIDIRTSLEDHHIWLSFTDNGLGIDMERYGDKIFGMYKTFHRHKDAKGIGLFITKNQIEAMNGTIEVESEVGKGTTFHLRFEISEPNPSSS